MTDNENSVAAPADASSIVTFNADATLGIKVSGYDFTLDGRDDITHQVVVQLCEIVRGLEGRIKELEDDKWSRENNDEDES